MIITNRINPVEFNGNRHGASEHSISVNSHWNRKDLVVIEIAEDQFFTVLATELHAAIRNATNTGR